MVSSVATVVPTVESNANNQAFAPHMQDVAEVPDDAEHQSATDNVAASGAEMGDPEWLEPWQSDGGLRGMGTETWNTHDTTLGLDESYKKRLKTYCTCPQMM